VLYKKWSDKNNKKIIWENPEDRQFWRREFRNSNKHSIDNNSVSFGALTGEKTADFFIKTGSLELNREDIIIFYSDGFKQSLERKDFLTALKKDLLENKIDALEQKDNMLAEKDYSHYGSERTLIAIAYLP